MIIKNFYRLKKQYMKLFEKYIFRIIYYSFFSFLILRVFTSSVLLIGIFQPSPAFPYEASTQNNILLLEQKSESSKVFIAPWYRWDTVHYIEIADFGYDFSEVNSVWPPLYPFLINITSLVIQPTLSASLIVSNIFFIIGLSLFYILTKEILSEEISKQSIFYLIFFPTSFFFVAGYTESLFFSFSIGVFLSLRKKKWLLAGILSCLATMARVQGLILTIPIFYELIVEFLKEKELKNFIINSISTLLAPFSYLIFSLYVFYGLGNNWPWQTLSEVWNLHFGFPWEGIIGNLLLLIGKPIDIDVTPDLVKGLNLFITFLAIFLLFSLRKKIPVSISLYSWIMLFVAIGKIDNNSALVSVTRYVLTIFPLFWGFALLINHKYIKLLFFTFSVILQIILLVYFYWWYWVA